MTTRRDRYNRRTLPISNGGSRLLLALALGILLAGSGIQAQDERATIQVKLDAVGGNARIVLTHSHQVDYLVRETDERIEVVYTDPVLASPSRQRFEGSTMSRFVLRGSDTLVFDKGPGYRSYQTFELRNPFRLVIDIQGASAEGGDAVGLPGRRDPSLKIVVLDPGHGGVEQGAIGPGGLLEKEVTLQLARRLKQELQNDPSIGVVLTRDEDRLVGLDERTAIANHNRADLFVSIHLNASPRRRARGAETYFLSNDSTDDEARTLAALENQASGVEKTEIFAEGERRDLELVLWDLAQNRFLAESSALAESMQRHLNALTGTRNRGVRQAPFRVLMGATMPAILVEAGFITNSEEEDRFRSMGYRGQVVAAMTAAIREFIEQLESRPQPMRLGRPGTASP